VERIVDMVLVERMGHPGDDGPFRSVYVDVLLLARNAGEWGWFSKTYRTYVPPSALLLLSFCTWHLFLLATSTNTCV
jgi:hypothetical protein